MYCLDFPRVETDYLWVAQDSAAYLLICLHSGMSLIAGGPVWQHSDWLSRMNERFQADPKMDIVLTLRPGVC